jgi:diacylglycerol kinase family enzyme
LVRRVAATAALVLAVFAVVLGVLSLARHPGYLLGAVASLSLGFGAAAAAFRVAVPLPPAPRPLHPVVFLNPRSGGGKVQRFRVREAAHARGIEPVELAPGANLEELARLAVERGADALAVAGGDGSQAIVAHVAAELGLPYACIPAGTRNHFALDLGVDRDDVVGALDAFIDGGERRVDLGNVNGRTFVNNVSLGVYGEAVQRPEYRGAKLRTLLATVPEVLGPGREPELDFSDPHGKRHSGAAVVVVSNNTYRLAPPVREPTRPRLDAGVLGVSVLERGGPSTWSAPSFEVDARAPVRAGIDGEPVLLTPPLRFCIKKGFLRCRIARHHPGASPSAFVPGTLWQGICALFRLAGGREPR